MCNNKKTIWKMNLLHCGHNSFEFCKRKGIVGFGWGLRKNTAYDYEHYKMLTIKEGIYYSNNKFVYALQCAMNCFEEMKPGDLILLHDKEMNYYLCIVKDEYISINQGYDFYMENVTCNRKVHYLDLKIDKEDIDKLGLEQSVYTSRHTCEKIRENSEDNNKLIDFLMNIYLSSKQ